MIDMFDHITNKPSQLVVSLFSSDIQMDVLVEMFHRSRMRSTERSPASDARVYLGIGEMQGICTAIVGFCV